MAIESNPRQKAGRQGHEKTDANVAWIFAILACLALLLVALHFIGSGLLGYWEKKQPPTDEWSPKTAQALPTSPRFPRLQISPPTDLNEFRKREDAELNSYGWLNQTAGVVRIPIDQAMDLLLKNPPPVRTGPQADKLGPTSVELRQQWSTQPPAKK